VWIGSLSYNWEWVAQYLTLLYIPLLYRWYKDSVILEGSLKLLRISIVAFLVESTNERFPLSILGMMTLWAFMDSTLFETLSRDPSISIWRGGYELPIILFHFAGIVTALFGHTRSTDKERFILLLFALSYLSYFFHEALVLAMVYPFVISYYNVVILQEVIKIKSFGTIVIVMICIGWIASGIGLMVALQGLIGIVVPIWLIAIGWMIKINFKTKEIHHV